MNVYKRSGATLVRGLASSAFGCIVVYFAANYFLKNATAAILSATVVGVIALYFTVLHNNIHVEIDDQGFRFYRRGQLKSDVKFQDVVKYRLRSSQKSDTDNLTFELQDDSSELFDLFPLGITNVSKIWEDLSNRLGDAEELETEELEAEKKD